MRQLPHWIRQGEEKEAGGRLETLLLVGRRRVGEREGGGRRVARARHLCGKCGKCGNELKAVCYCLLLSVTVTAGARHPDGVGVLSVDGRRRRREQPLRLVRACHIW